MESILLTVFANAQSLDKASASGSSEDTLEKRSLMNAKTCFLGGKQWLNISWFVTRIYNSLQRPVQLQRFSTLFFLLLECQSSANSDIKTDSCPLISTCCCISRYLLVRCQRNTAPVQQSSLTTTPSASQTSKAQSNGERISHTHRHTQCCAVQKSVNSHEKILLHHSVVILK